MYFDAVPTLDKPRSDGQVLPKLTVEKNMRAI